MSNLSNIPDMKFNEEPIHTWSLNDVSEWLKKSGFSRLVSVFFQEEVDGQTLISLTEEDLRITCKCTLGERKKILMLLDQLKPKPKDKEKKVPDALQQSKSQDNTKNKSLSRQFQLAGKWLPKGYLPKGPTITEKQLENIRRFYFNHEQKKLLPRDVLLSEEELECWKDQSEWLICPITGKSWHDQGTILGLALYHEPRCLPESEKKRRLADDKAKTEKNLQVRAHGGGYIANRSDWERNFEVYPSVPKPKLKSKNEDLPDNINLGHIEVIIGPVFDVDSYNWGIEGKNSLGILSAESRGMLSMDNQYDATNFQYFIERANNSFQRKRCTNRLSFFIDELHGRKVFPKNIESQLSLLLYRDATRLKDHYGNTDQDMLARSIRLAIPRIIKAVVLELHHADTSSRSLPLLTHHTIRSYLLVHQVSVRLLVHYELAYKTLFRSVSRWIQNPFESLNRKEWDNFEELLIAASLIGFPWPALRNSFMRVLVSSMIQGHRKKIWDRISITNVFEKNLPLVHRILYELSFFTGRSLTELDRVYLRCAGSLPRREREAIAHHIADARRVVNIEEFWNRSGMTESGEDIFQEIIDFFDFVQKNIPIWENEHLSEHRLISVPNQNDLCDPQSGALQKLMARVEKQIKDQKHDSEMREIHRGFPLIPGKNKILDPLRCNYPGCGKLFKNRQKLFRHLFKYIGKDRMVKDFHKSHSDIRVNRNPPSINGHYSCLACQRMFDSQAELISHYAILGVPGFTRKDIPILDLEPVLKLEDSRKGIYNNRIQDDPIIINNVPSSSSNDIINSDDTKMPDNPKLLKKQSSSYNDVNICAICMDAPRDVVFNPCGHVVSCKKCASLLRECPVCRNQIQTTINLYHA